jgi:hypothetical protein
MNCVTRLKATFSSFLSIALKLVITPFYSQRQPYDMKGLVQSMYIANIVRDIWDGQVGWVVRMDI